MIGTKLIKILAIVAVASIAAMLFVSLWMTKSLTSEINRKRTERARETKLSKLKDAPDELEQPKEDENKVV